MKFLQKKHSQYETISIAADNVNKLPEGDIHSCVWEAISHCSDEKVDVSHSSYTGISVESVLSEVDDIDSDAAIIVENSGVVDVNSTSVSSQETASAAAQKLHDPALVLPHCKIQPHSANPP